MDSQGPAHGGFEYLTKAYLNNASVSVQPLESIHAMTDFVTKYCSVGPDSLESGGLVSDVLREARDALARVIGCERDELVLTQSTTDGVNMVSRGMALRDSNIVIRGGAHEHHSNYYAWLRLAPDTDVRIAPIDGNGLIQDGALDRLVDSKTRLVALSHALYNTGAILPVGEIGADLRERGIAFFVDAAQTVGCMGELDVHKMGCDFMSFNGSKWLCGPMGIGAFYCRKGSEDLIEPLAVGGESAMVHEGRIVHRQSPDKFQAGFRNYVGAVGMTAAIRHMERYGLQRVRDTAISLAGRLREGIARIPGATMYGPPEEDARTSIVPFEISGHEPDEIVKRLESEGMVLAVREIVDKKIVRASPHFFNTDAQIDSLVSSLSTLALR